MLFCYFLEYILSITNINVVSYITCNLRKKYIILYIEICMDISHNVFFGVKIIVHIEKYFILQSLKVY